jgi:hypothetical protein
VVTGVPPLPGNRKCSRATVPNRCATRGPRGVDQGEGDEWPHCVQATSRVEPSPRLPIALAPWQNVKLDHFRDRSDTLLWKRERDVEVRNGQQLRLPVASGRLA